MQWLLSQGPAGYIGRPPVLLGGAEVAQPQVELDLKVKGEEYFWIWRGCLQAPSCLIPTPLVWQFFEA